MRYRTILLACLLSLPSALVVAEPYEALVAANVAKRADALSVPQRRVFLEQRFDALAKQWLGTAWGLGSPQTGSPGTGKINCGTFVGRLLRDLGFELSVRKLQRQPAELIIKSLARSEAIQRFRNRPIEEFIDAVRASGDGVYVIGLDFHVGFLRVAGPEVRFVHASYETGDVVDEDAATAMPITTSKYRVVGKIFSDALLDKWARGERIKIRGNW